MLVHCPKCHMMYDDATNTTICPHDPLGGGSGGYCKRHDLFGPCPLCRPVPPEDRHPVTRAVVRDDFMAGESAPMAEMAMDTMTNRGIVREEEMPPRRVEEQVEKVHLGAATDMRWFACTSCGKNWVQKETPAKCPYCGVEWQSQDLKSPAGTIIVDDPYDPKEMTDEQRRAMFDWWTQAASKRFRNVWPAGAEGPTVECCNCGARLSHSDMTTHECEVRDGETEGRAEGPQQPGG